MAYHLAKAGWRDIVLIEKGTLPNPGGSTGHASNFIFLTDHSKEMTAFTVDSARQYQELGRVQRDRRHRGRSHAGADGGAQAPHGLLDVVGDRGHAAHDASRGQGDGPVHRRDRDPRRLLHAGRRRRRLAPGRHADAPGRPGDGRADRRRGRRGDRRRRRGRPRPARPYRRRDRRRRRRRHRLRHLEPAHRPDGRCVHPAPAGRPPDDRRRTGAAVRRRQGRGRVPDRARHGHEHVRAPARERLRDRLVCPSRDPDGGGRHPVDRRVRTVADDAAVHAGGLRSAARGRPRARSPRSSATRRVGQKLRDQRPAVAHAGRQPDHRRDARGQGPLVGGGDLDQGGARDRAVRRRVDDPRDARDRPARLGHRAVLRPPQDRPAHRRADDRGLQQDLRHRPPDGAVGLEPADPPLARRTTGTSSSARSSSRRPAGSGRSGTARTRRCWASTASA